MTENDDGIDFETQTLDQITSIAKVGLGASTLAELFRVNIATMNLALTSLTPAGHRRNKPIYQVADVAPLVVKPTLDVESYIKKLKPKDLPPALQKAFWDAQEARQSFEEKAGNLWHTHRVQHVVGKLVMVVRQRLVLATDQVDRLAPLTEEQRKIVQGTFDQIIVELQKQVVEAFKDYDGAGDRQDIYENGPPLPFRAEPDVDDGLGL